MDVRRVRLPLALLPVLLFAGVLLSLHFMAEGMRHSAELGESYSWLLGVNLLGGLLLLVLVGVNVFWLLSRLKKREAGSRLTARMAFLFILLTLAPASIVYYFSMQFLHRGIDSWFDVHVDQAMEDALALGQAVLDERTRALVESSEEIAASLEDISPATVAQLLGELREKAGASELTLFGHQGRILASSGAAAGSILPSLPDERIVMILQRGQPYVGLEPAGPPEQGMRVRVVSRLDSPEGMFLQALYAIPPRIGYLAESVENAYMHYKRMNYLRQALKFSFSLALSLVLLLSLLAAVWAAFVSIRRIVAPVRDLALATQAVAAGRYEQQLPVQSRDELGFLVESFNDMTRRIARAHDETQRSRLEVEHQRAYLETILANLSSGVIGFDALMRVRSANQAASAILGVDVETCLNRPITDLAEAHPHLAPLTSAVGHHLAGARSPWHREVTLNGPAGRQELLLRGTPLFSAWGYWAGSVLVFDDVTQLLQAQRATAWSEMARRLAHEIKNPLTPIQLSAERLRHKLSRSLSEGDAEVLEKSTRTIVQQVEAMKAMVNAFNDYARPAKIQPVPLDLGALVDEIVALYPSSSGVEFEVERETDLPPVLGDPIPLRQVLHNLIKNVQEAVGSEAPGRISIRLYRPEEEERMVALDFRDNGPGIPAELRERLFEPYVTGKTRGTGLGLAIVKKIVEEHGGQIRIDADCRDGAGFVLTLPVAPEAEGKGADDGEGEPEPMPPEWG